MKKANVTTHEGRIKIKFNGSIKKKNVVEMVERCQTGKCECMSEESKQKIENIEVSDKTGNVELIISGNLKQQEIEDAVSRSSLIGETL